MNEERINLRAEAQPRALAMLRAMCRLGGNYSHYKRGGQSLNKRGQPKRGVEGLQRGERGRVEFLARRGDPGKERRW